MWLLWGLKYFFCQVVFKISSFSILTAISDVISFSDTQSRHNASQRGMIKLDPNYLYLNFMCESVKLFVSILFRLLPITITFSWKQKLIVYQCWTCRYYHWCCIAFKPPPVPDSSTVCSSASIKEKLTFHTLCTALHCYLIIPAVVF